MGATTKGGPPTRQFRTYAADLRAGSAGNGTIEGYAAVLHNIDEYGTVMGKGCFDRDLAAFIERGFIGGLNHNWDAPIGSIASASVDDRGLRVVGSLIDDPEAQRCRKLVHAKVCRGLSIGFEVLDSEHIGDRRGIEDYWRACGYSPSERDTSRADSGVILFKRVRVYEFSPVMVAGNQEAEITASRSAPRPGRSGRTMASAEDVAALRRELIELEAYVYDLGAI